MCDSKESLSFSGKKRNSKDPRVKNLINHFYNLCKGELDQEPIIEGAKDGSAIKRVLTTKNDDQIKNIFNWYIKSPKTKEHGLRIAVALSDHSLQQYEKTAKWLYEG